MTNAVPLSREFRPYLKAKIQALPAWSDYARGKGFEGRAHLMTAQDWRQAAADMGLNLKAEYAAFVNSPGAKLLPVTEAIDAMNMESETDMSAAKTDLEAPEEVLQGFEGRNIKDVIDEALAPASAHLTPYLANRLPDLLRPIVEAATKGPRVVEREVIVQAPASSASGDVAPIPLAKVRSKETLGRAFGLSKNVGGRAFKHALDNLQIDICECSAAPRVDPEYVWQPDVLAQLAVCDVSSMPAWLFGHKGTGKTVGATQYAARLGRPFVRIAINRETQPGELIGQILPTKDGGTEWRDGPLTRAFRTPRVVLLIDEPTLLRSGSLAVFQTVLDTREIHLPTGEIVRAAPGVFIVAADNTAGVGDDSGQYVDTSAINAATLDRFALRINVGFLPAEKESAMLARKADLPLAACKMIVDYANLTRADAASGKITIGVTFRRLASWALAVKHGVGSEAAFFSAVLSGASPEDRESLAMLGKSNVKHVEIDALARGEALPSPDAPIVSDADTPQGGVSSNGLRFPVE